MATPMGDLPTEDPEDREIVALLARLAAARADLIAAEARAADGGVRVPPRNAPIEEARADVLWAQAQLCSGGRTGRAKRRLAKALETETAVLRRFGFRTFAEYARQRTTPPTGDGDLEAARACYQQAQEDWDTLQARIRRFGAPRSAPELVEDAPRPML